MDDRQADPTPLIRRPPSEGFETAPDRLDWLAWGGAMLLACAVASLILLVFIALLSGCGSTAVPTAPSGPTALPATAPSTPAVASKCRSVDGLPDRTCTPGATNPAVTQGNLSTTICRAGWTATVRPPVSYTDALKAKQMQAYGDAGPASSYEEDHLVPLEVGGSPTDPHNLWPEPWAGIAGAHAKDSIENRVKREVCAGQLTLAQGRSIFETDWRNG